jgi:iron(III) transport system substrate-binding protein
MFPVLRSMLGASAVALSALVAAPYAAVHAQEITVYSAGPAGLARGLSEGFTKATGTQVKLFQATTGKVMARIEAERANPQVDVLISASWSSAVDLKARGDLAAYESPNAAQVPDVLKDSHYVAQGAAAIALVWNSKSGRPKPSDWSDLARPEYRDAVTMPDPAASGAAYGLIEGLIAAKGDGAWQMLESLKVNGMIVPGANAQALNPVLQGARSAVFGAVDYIALGAQKKGEAIEVIYPSTGTVVEARPMMILRWSKNPDAAKKFIDYVLSDEGQKMVAATLMLPARTDIHAQRTGWADIKLLPAAEESDARRAATLARFRRVMGM